MWGNSGLGVWVVFLFLVVWGEVKKKRFGNVLQVCYVCVTMKTKPTSIRFDEEKLKFFQEKFPNLTTPQKVVDYFLDTFWWSEKIQGQNKPVLAPQTLPSIDTPQPKQNNAANVRKPMPAVEVKNLNTEQKTNYTINTEKPVRMEGEDALDYGFRVSEWKKLQK